MRKIIASLAASILFAGLAQADNTPLKFTSFAANNNGNQQTLGYQFSVTQQVSVTALSYFDNGNDGLLSLHTVGLYDSTGTLLASTTIPVGTVATLQDGFRSVNLATPIVLTPGTTYLVGGTSGGSAGLDSYAQMASGVTVGQSITYLASAQAPDVGATNPLTFPNNPKRVMTPGYGFYGGSFLYAVPKPSAWAFLLGATGCLFLLRARWLLRPLGAGLAILLTAGAAHAQNSGDNLNWIGGTGASAWTDPGKVWNDVGAVTAGVGPTSISNSTGNTYGFFFIGNNPGQGTVAPNTMSIDSVLNANFISFLDGFAAGNNMTIGRLSTNGNLANSLNLVNGWQIADRGTGGTVTFSQYTTGVSYGGFGGLYFTASGAGGFTVATGANVFVNVPVSGSGSIDISKPPTDNGAGGIVTFAPPNDNGNSYSGGTTVTSGTLVLAGGSTVSSASGTGAITVSSGAKLAGFGYGFSNTTVNSGGVLSPGTSASPVAILHLGGNGLGGGVTINGQLSVDIVGGGTVAGVNNDQIVVTGTLSLGTTSSTLLVNVANPTGLAIGQKFFLTLDGGATPVIGTFNGLLQGATVTDSAGDTYTISYLDNGDNGTLGNDVSLTVASVVPEPSTVATVSAAGALLLLVVLRRRQSA